MQETPFHSLTVQEVLDYLHIDPNIGLSTEMLENRKDEIGHNFLIAKNEKSNFLRFLEQIKEPLVLVLIFAGIISLIIGEYIDSLVIFGVVILNAILGFYQESKALRAIKALTTTSGDQVTVIRASETYQIPTVELIVGDIVLLQAGQKVPADCRIISSINFATQESILTGESVPVQTNINPVRVESELFERTNIVFSSTLVVQGTAKVIVIAIGNNTQIGSIQKLLDSAQVIETPLTRNIAQVTTTLIWGISGMAVIAFGIGLLQGKTVTYMFTASVALAVGAIPEGLPSALTIMLAIGVSRMAKKNALIRKLPAVETLGSTTVICTDKTGTLTLNSMTVTDLVTVSNKHYGLTGNGLEINGDFLLFSSDQVPSKLETTEILLDGDIVKLLQVGFLCHDVIYKIDNDLQLSANGDPTEIALVVAALKFNSKVGSINSELLLHKSPIHSHIPFDSTTQIMATHHKIHNQNVVYLKGSFERISELCKLDYEVYQYFERTIQNLALQGKRVIACAIGRIEQFELQDISQIESIEFVGIQAMIDPPRPEAKMAIAQCHQAGIDVKMITGDHIGTAKAIGFSLGLHNQSGELLAIAGREFDSANDEEKKNIVATHSVFARVTPEQKLRFVQLLQEQHHVVAMTGDGVNDAPALRQANIGIAMGITGTEVAKEAADMVLKDDNFASIVAAVREGRTLFDNLLKFIAWTLPANIALGVIILFSFAAGVDLPIIPVQILWINMTTVVFLGTTLVFEPSEDSIMSRKPRNVNAKIISNDIVMRTLFISSILVVAVFSVFIISQHYLQNSFHASSTIATNTVVIILCFYVLNSRSWLDSLRSIGFFSNHVVYYGIAVMLIFQLIFTYVPAMNLLFRTEALELIEWILPLATGFCSFLIIGLEKYLRKNYISQH